MEGVQDRIVRGLGGIDAEVAGGLVAGAGPTAVGAGG